MTSISNKMWILNVLLDSGLVQKLRFIMLRAERLIACAIGTVEHDPNLKFLKILIFF